MNFSYIKKALQKSKVTLEDLARQTDIPVKYIEQLINNEILSPSIKNIKSIHKILNITDSNSKRNIGVIFGKFYPLHTGHIHLIQSASGLVDELHIYVCYDEEIDNKLFNDSNLRKQPTIQDRLRWMQQTFKYQDTIKIHALNEEMLPDKNSWDDWSKRALAAFKNNNITPSVIFSNEENEIPKYEKYLKIKAKNIDSEKKFMNISATKIRKNPMRYWKYIPTEVRPFFVTKIAILGGESSGKSTITNKLANAFNTSSAWEYGREYIFKELGGDEQALQYSDYPKIALGQANYIDYAKKRANKVVFVDTDFITTQAFCVKYENKEHPFLNAMIKEYSFDKIILLKNNTPWVADGLRTLGDVDERESFQELLIKLLKDNNIEFTEITSSNYNERYQECIDIVSDLLEKQK